MTGTKLRSQALWVLPALCVLGVVQVANRPLVSEARAAMTPAGLLDAAAAECAELRDYTCVFAKQERMDGRLKERETMQVSFRAAPYSVHMHWVENPQRVRRALYVAGRNRDEQGREQVLVEPASPLARAFKPKVAVELHGEEARKASRRSLADFGFTAAVERLTTENARFEREGVLKWEPVRIGVIDGRPTYVLVRHLPYDGPGGRYPNARLVVHLDQEWLLPVSLRSYADHAGRELLEEYTWTHVALNPGLPETAFEF